MRRDATVAATIVFVGATSASACGLTADFSGLQGGTRDAGGDAPGVGTLDAADAGGDVADAAATDVGFCQSLPTPVHFCADFDESPSVSAGWTSTDVYQGSTVSLDDVYFSSPASFLSTIQDNGQEGSARLQEDVPIDTPHVHVEFEMLVPPLNGNFEICTLHQPTPDGTTYGVFYKYQSGNLLVFMRTLADDGGEVDVVNQIGAPPAGWLHVEIDCDVSASGNIVVKHDGAVVVNDTNVNTSTLTRTAMFVELGYYSFDPASAQAHFDNVVVDWQ